MFVMIQQLFSRPKSYLAFAFTNSSKKKEYYLKFVGLLLYFECWLFVLKKKNKTKTAQLILGCLTNSSMNRIVSREYKYLFSIRSSLRLKGHK